MLFRFPVYSEKRRLSPVECASTGSPLNRKEIREDLFNPAVLLPLGAMLLFYCSQALVFFFLDPFGRSVGIGSTGLFLTLATAGEIGILVAAADLLDRMNKVRLVVCTMLGVGVACVLLAQVQKELPFLVLGVAFGLGWGIAIPVFSSLMFDFSPVRLRAFNTNLGMQMFQAGYFIGPFIGAPLVAHWGFSVLFDLCAAFCIGSSGLAFLLGFKARRRAGC